MHPVIDKILSELREETGISKVELERMIDVQFKIVREHIETRDPRTISLIHLGKFKMSDYYKNNGRLVKKIQGDS